MPNTSHGKIVAYSTEYMEKLFEVWYKLGCPQATAFHRYLESNFEASKDAYGRLPGINTLESWANEGWLARKDLLDARVATHIDNELVALKVNMLREQAAAFRQVRQKAQKFLMENDFDTSAAAVSAFIKASQEERVALGLSKTIQKLAEMDDDELMQNVKQLASKVSNVIDASEVVEDEDEG